MRKKQRNKSILLRVTAFIFIGFLLVNLGYYQVRLANINSQLDALESEKQAKEQQVVELTRLLETSNDPEFIENAARKRLGYVYANERIYYDSWGN